MQIRITPNDKFSAVETLEQVESVPETSTCDNIEICPDVPMMYGMDRRLPITAKLKALRKGDSVSFPIEKRQSVYSVANRLKKELVKWAWNFKLIDDIENFTVTIVRIS